MPHYKLTAPNGKSYHGITTLSVNRRMTGHRTAARNGSTYPLHAAIRKYGFDAFKLEVLNESKDLAELHCLEVEAIARDNTVAPNGYNLTAGGEGTTGHRVSEEQRAAIALRTKERWKDQSFAEMKRRNSSETIRRLNADPNHKAKLQAASRAYWSNPENVAKRTEQVRRLREVEPERFEKASAGLVNYNISKAGREKSREVLTKLRAEQTSEQRREISMLSVAARAKKKAERDAHLATLSVEEAEAIRADERAKKSAATKAGRAAKKAARTPEEEAAVRERYRQAAINRHAKRRSA